MVGLTEIAELMLASGLSESFVDSVLSAAQNSEGFRDLMELWLEFPGERDAIVKDLYEHLEDLK